jgi:DNA repair protein RadC
VKVHTKEVLRAALACDAEKVVCARTSPDGTWEPTAADVATALRLRKAFQMMDMEMVDYYVVGERMSSLEARGCFLRAD